MNSSDDKAKDQKNRTIRAMQMLGFSFPPDIRRTGATIEELPVEYMLRIRTEFKENFTSWVSILDSYADRITWSTCNICEKEEMAYDEIPKDWGWYNVSSDKEKPSWYLMCTNCQNRYAEKFNKIPEVVREI